MGLKVIHGANITTDTLEVSRIKSSAANILTGSQFGLGAGASFAGLNATIAADTSSTSRHGIVSVSTDTSWGNFAIVGAVKGNSAYAAAFQSQRAADTVFNSQVLLGSLLFAGDFQNNRLAGFASASATAGSISGTTFTAGGTITGTFAVGMALSGTGVASNTRILSGSGTSWTVTVSQTVTSTTITGSQSSATTQIQLATSFYAAYLTNGGVGPFTGSHDALLSKLTEIDIGDLVCDNGQVIVKDFLNTITFVERTTTAAQAGSVGVFYQYFDGLPASLSISVYDPQTGGQKTVLNPEYAPLLKTHDVIGIAALGEGLINVCSQGGDIAVGDLLCTSDMPGKAMRQSDDVVRSTTVAKSRQPFVFAPGQAWTQIACIYLCG